LDGAGIGIQDEEALTSGERQNRGDVKRSLRYSKAAIWAAFSGRSPGGSFFLVSLVRILAMCA